MGAGEQILEALAALNARLDVLEDKVDKALAAKPVAATPAQVAAVDPGDLDSEYGNFAVRKDPPRWKGESYAGRRLSECPPDYLDALAGFFDWRASKDAEKGTPEGDKYAGYGRKDAARARAWAQRLRANPPPVAERVPGGDDELPF